MISDFMFVNCKETSNQLCFFEASDLLGQMICRDFYAGRRVEV